MNYVQYDHFDEYIFAGSAMVGSFIMTFEELRDRFGEPTFVGGQRTDVRWLFVRDDGVVFTIYNDKKVRGQADNNWFLGGFGKYDKKTKMNYSYEFAVQVLGL